MDRQALISTEAPPVSKVRYRRCFGRYGKRESRQCVKRESRKVLRAKTERQLPVPKGYVPLLYGQLGKQYISRDRLRPVKCFISDLYIGFCPLRTRPCKEPGTATTGKGISIHACGIDMKRSKLTFIEIVALLRDAGIKNVHIGVNAALEIVSRPAKGRPGHAVREYSRTCSRTSAHRSFRYSTGVHYRGAVRSTRAYNVQTPSRRG